MNGNELDEGEDSDRDSDSRVFWSDSRGFPDVRVDEGHRHPVRRKSYKMKWFIAMLRKKTK